MRVFNGTNKIYPNSPIKGSVANKGDINYYWFVTTAAIKFTSWKYDIGLGF